MEFVRHVPNWQPATSSASNSPIKSIPDLLQLSKSPLDMSFLQSARIVQSSLVFLKNLPLSLLDESLLLSSDYLGQYGSILKLALNKSGGIYVTFSAEQEAAMCIKALNDFSILGSTLSATHGTTKYCSYFLSNRPCPKPNCLFLHKLASHKNTMNRDWLPNNKHIQPENALIDKLNIEVSPNSNGFPHARIVRARLSSHNTPKPTINLETVKHRRFHSRGLTVKSRYSFIEENAEEAVELPDYCKEIMMLASPSNDLAELSSSHVEEIMSPSSPDKWALDVMDVQRLSDYISSPSNNDTHLIFKK